MIMHHIDCVEAQINTNVGPRPIVPRYGVFSANTALQFLIFKWLRNLLFGRGSVASQC
jgi:hypothetical protein